VQRAARAAELVNRSLPEEDRVTQFEALTAAAYSELARRGAEVAVIEAGPGGRHDATNVIPPHVHALTTAALEQTPWLGPTIAHIPAQQPDVARDCAPPGRAPARPASSTRRRWSRCGSAREPGSRARA